MLSRLATPAGTERPLLGRSGDLTGRLSPTADSPDASTITMNAGTKLACFDWPPPPSPASRSKPSPLLSNFKGGASGFLFGGTGELNLCDTSSASAPSTDMRNRGELWEIRGEIEREKLRMVAPFPFFGCPMRFSDDFAALQIAQDGRFSFSEVCLEVVEPDSSLTPSRTKAIEVKRIITYEGVFTGPYVPGEEEEDQQTVPKGTAKPKESSAEEQKPESDPELAAIEATALVKHEIVESGGRSKLVLVERGAFRFAITVTPFFHPNYATIKVLNRCRGHPPARARRLPYVGPGGPSKSAGGTAKRSNSLVGAKAAETRQRRRSGGPRLMSSASPFRSAAAGSLASPLGLRHQTRKLHGCCSTPQLRLNQSYSDWKF